MSVPRNIWLQFIVDAQSKSLYVDSNGVIQKSSPPVPLPQLAKGWKDTTISFGTNEKYWNLQRSYTVPMFFVGDGATICRDAIYNKKGYEEELYLIVLKLNPNTGIYDLEYRGRLDFSKNIDEPRKGITVNTIEGGVLTKLLANDAVEYEMPLDPSNNTGVVQILFDGTNLYDKYKFSVVHFTVDKPTDFNHHVMAYTLPFPFISNDGDSVNVIHGSQQYADVAHSGTWTNSLINAYTDTSANYFFSSTVAISIRVTGTMKFYVNQAGGNIGFHIILKSSLGTVYDILGTDSSFVFYTSPQQVDVVVDIPISLAADEKLFLIAVVSSNSVSSQSVEWKTTDLFVEFSSKVPPTTAFGLRIIDVLKQLVLKMTDGKYTGNSVYFSNNNHLVWTSTNALQNYAFQCYYGSFELIESGGVYEIKIPGELKTLPAGNQLVITGAASQNGVYTVKSVSAVISGFTTITVVEPVTDATLSGTLSTVPDLKLSFQDFFNDVDCLYNVGMKIVNDVVYIEPKADLYNDDVTLLLTRNVALSLTEWSLAIFGVGSGIAADRFTVVLNDGIHPAETYSYLAVLGDTPTTIRAAMIALINTSSNFVATAFTNVSLLQRIGIHITCNTGTITVEATITAEIFDLGEIANLKIHYATDLLCNTGTFGYKSQDYRQRNGIYEFNTTTVFKFPVGTLKKDYTKVLKSRGDCFGIEFIRFNALNKPTQDNTGDNQPFLVNTRAAGQDLTAFVVTFMGPDTIVIPSTVSIVVNDVLEITASTFNDGTYTVVSVVVLGTSLLVKVTGGTITSDVAATINLHFVVSNSVKIFREAYSSISGVKDNTVYNIEEMSPHRLLFAHANTIKSLLVQLQSQEVIFRTANKNAALSTTLAGVTIAERQSEVVSGLPGELLFLPYVAEFTTPVPITFAKIMSSIGCGGYVKGTWLGTPLYFLPIGKMDAKPAINSAQSWSLMLAPKNDLAIINSLSLEGLFTLDTMGNSIFATDLNPLHFTKYNYSLPSKYKHKELYDDHFQNRTEDYISQPYYCQKWQKGTDTIPIQIITRGLATPDVEVYNSEGKIYSTNPMVVSADPAVLSPYVLWNYDVNMTAFPDDIYFIVISCGGTKLLISEYLDIKSDHPKTLLFEAYHTTNKFNTYFNSFSVKLRVEGTMLAWFPDSTFEPYTNELDDHEVLDGIPISKRNLRLGNSYGVPDWMALKINKILLLNRCYIDGVRYSRTPESKIVKKEITGHPMNSYLIELSKAVNRNGIGINEDGTEEEIMIAYTLNGYAFGMADDGSTINIELPLEP